MEKEDCIPPSRRRAARSGRPGPTALATPDGSGSAGPADGDARPGQYEALTEGRPGERRDGMVPRTAAPGLAGTEAQPGEPPALPRRVRGMSDGPRPPVQVARPVLPPSFLERVRAAAEAEQLLEQHTQEQTEKPAEARPEAAMVRLPEPRRPPRFVRSRDWMTRNADKNADKKGQSRVDQTGPEERRRAPGDQPSSAGDGAADGRASRPRPARRPHCPAARWARATGRARPRMSAPRPVSAGAGGPPPGGPGGGLLN